MQPREPGPPLGPDTVVGEQHAVGAATPGASTASREAGSAVTSPFLPPGIDLVVHTAPLQPPEPKPAELGLLQPPAQSAFSAHALTAGTQTAACHSAHSPQPSIEPASSRRPRHYEDREQGVLSSDTIPHLPMRSTSMVSRSTRRPSLHALQPSKPVPIASRPVPIASRRAGLSDASQGPSPDADPSSQILGSSCPSVFSRAERWGVSGRSCPSSAFLQSVQQQQPWAPMSPGAGTRSPRESMRRNKSSPTSGLHVMKKVMSATSAALAICNSTSTSSRAGPLTPTQPRSSSLLRALSKQGSAEIGVSRTSSSSSGCFGSSPGCHQDLPPFSPGGGSRSSAHQDLPPFSPGGGSRSSAPMLLVRPGSTSGVSLERLPSRTSSSPMLQASMSASLGACTQSYLSGAGQGLEAEALEGGYLEGSVRRAVGGGAPPGGKEGSAR